jgi:hypothetical protein
VRGGVSIRRAVTRQTDHRAMPTNTVGGVAGTRLLHFGSWRVRGGVSIRRAVTRQTDLRAMPTNTVNGVADATS